MAFIEFSLTDKTFIEAKHKWRGEGKTEAEISTLTTKLIQTTNEQREQKQRDAAARGEVMQVGKFPKWLKVFLRDQVARFGNGAKLKWDADNDSYHARMPQSDDELLEWTDPDGEFTKAYSAELAKLPPDELKAFCDNWQLHPSLSYTDGAPEMADLKSHLEAGETRSNQEARKQGAGAGAECCEP